MNFERFWEIDFLRGIALILMLVFNYSFALFFLGIYNVNGGWFFWYLFPRLIGAMFITISGVSLVLGKRKSYIQKGLQIFGLGLLITLATYIYAPNQFIVFGILHLIGVATIFSIPFMKYERLNLFLGLLLVVIGFLLQTLRFDFSWLLWLGFYPANFQTLDYFPLLPWFGFTLLGLYLGRRFYKNGKRQFDLYNLSNNLFINKVSLLGRHSLKIYLLHQPLLLAILLLFGFQIL